MDITPIPGHPAYALDKQGNAYRLRAGVWTQLKTYKSGGYARITIATSEGSKRENVHVLMAVTFLGLDRSKCGTGSGDLQVHHKNHDRGNNCLDNLMIVTKSENYRHAVEAGQYKDNGKACKGSPKSGMRMFTPEDIETIKELRRKGRSYRVIASRYGVDHKTIYQIFTGKSYQELL